jgi:hypothetical protein
VFENARQILGRKVVSQILDQDLNRVPVVIQSDTCGTAVRGVRHSVRYEIPQDESYHRAIRAYEAASLNFNPYGDLTLTGHCFEQLPCLTNEFGQVHSFAGHRLSSSFAPRDRQQSVHDRLHLQRNVQCIPKSALNLRIGYGPAKCDFCQRAQLRYRRP